MFGNEKLCGLFFICSALSPLLFGEKLGDGCGHSVLGPESGVLTSKNYPATYPNNTWCQVKLRVAEGSSIVLKFGDLDIEAQKCESDYVRILKGTFGNEHVYGPFCGNMKNLPREVHTESSEVTVQFRSGLHVSGRGFLLSYAAREHKDLLTCLDRGSHFSAAKYRKYCPAGCRAVAGEVSGDVTQGYRHTSVLCKAAVHAGAIRDEVGGVISVEEHKGLSRYSGTRANGIQSKAGSLSSTLFTFVTNDCKRQEALHPASVSASSWWRRGGEAERRPDWSPNGTHPDGGGCTWAADHGNESQWLQLDLGEKKKITGIIITACSLVDYDYYVQSFKVQYKERSWRTYTQSNSSEDTVFEGNLDGLHSSRSSFQPPIVARFLRIVPRTWHLRAAMRVELLGCPHVKGNVSAQITQEAVRPQSNPPEGDEEITQPVPSQTDLVKLAIIVVPTVLSVVLLLICVCAFVALQKKKTKETPYGSSDAQETGCWKQIKQPFARHQSTEFTISYSSEKEPIQKLDLVTSSMAEYQQPLMIGMGTVARKGSTFRPMDTEAKDEPGENATHYDYLHSANQYALPLTNQEPEYATPIIERHTFRKDGFLPDPSYSVPGVVLSKTPSFKTADCRKAGGFSGGYQTPQVKTDRPSNSEGVYDCPKVSVPLAQNGTCADYQRPQVKPSVMESYSIPRDSVRAGDHSSGTSGRT
ncbi:discoidin, CUB and LCCL domain-containing protein 1 [Megalops cyprinoides]|uniref:discoidin, CUB and LCCL domain-containing protein 1 n=1 Tax=Megalops cyprinoides TaxID=118141 RepID=UPI001864D74D|nr:discoidin, CUB and LCCL domain-containing protein 1 [Megalops cyprinoides]